YLDHRSRGDPPGGLLVQCLVANDCLNDNHDIVIGFRRTLYSEFLGRCSGFNNPFPMSLLLVDYNVAVRVIASEPVNWNLETALREKNLLVVLPLQHSTLGILRYPVVQSRTKA